MNIKFDLNTILYIVVSIIIIVASTLGRKKKKIVTRVPPQEYPFDKEEQPVMPERPFNPADYFREAMMQAAGVEKPQEIESEAQSLEEIIDEEEMIPEQETASLSLVMGTEPVITSRREPAVGDAVTEERDEGRIFQDPDDLRKAIIYSEILRRPDY